MCETNTYYINAKQSRNRPSVTQRVPAGLASQISMTFGTWSWWGCQPHPPAAFTPRKCSWYSFSLGAESTPGPWYGRKEYVIEKSSDTTGNRFRDRLNYYATPGPKSNMVTVGKCNINEVFAQNPKPYNTWISCSKCHRLAQNLF